MWYTNSNMNTIVNKATSTSSKIRPTNLNRSLLMDSPVSNSLKSAGDFRSRSIKENSSNRGDGSALKKSRGLLSTLYHPSTE